MHVVHCRAPALSSRNGSERIRDANSCTEQTATSAWVRLLPPREGWQKQSGSERSGGARRRGEGRGADPSSSSLNSGFSSDSASCLAGEGAFHDDSCRHTEENDHCENSCDSSTWAWAACPVDVISVRVLDAPEVANGECRWEVVRVIVDQRHPSH